MRKILFIFFLSNIGCAVIKALNIQSADSTSIKSFSSEELCRVVRDFPSYVTTTVKEEIAVRNLGDCSKAHLMCIQAGFKPDTGAFPQCKLQAMQMQQVLDAQEARDRGNFLGQSLQQSFQPKISNQNKKVTCTPDMFGRSVTCQEW